MTNKKSTVHDCIFLAACALIILFLGIGIYVLPQKSFSEAESRALAPPPSLSLSSLGNGRFFESLSSFYSDNLPLRRQMISVKAICELSLGKRENNGVIFCSDGRLTDRCEYDDLSLLRENLGSVRSFCDLTGAEYVLVPRSVDICSEYVSENAQSTVGELARSGLYDDVGSRLWALYSSGEEVYYKTDHHLNAEGAYAVYELIAGKLGFVAASEGGFEKLLVSDRFLGSTYSRSGLLPTAYDTITLYRYEGDEDYSIVCHDAGCQLCSLYDESKLFGKDKYAVFLGGNHGRVDISLQSGDRPRLLLIKDSFANAVIPLLARHFDLTVIDPRYYSGQVSALFDESYGEILVLCGIDTLATGGAFKGFIKKAEAS